MQSYENSCIKEEPIIYALWVSFYSTTNKKIDM